jgi:fatty aldehyde-generating acyl-ACP reductase
MLTDQLTPVAKVSVTLPVVVDFKAALSKAVTQDLSLNSVSIISSQHIALDSLISVRFCFANDFAYMNLSGRVVSSQKEVGYPHNAFIVEIEFLELSTEERGVLKSCLQALDVYLTKLDEAHPAEASASIQGESIGSTLAVSPRTIISVFVTDNPYMPEYRPNRFEQPDSLRSGASEGNTRPPSPKKVRSKASWILAVQGLALALGLLRDLIIRIFPEFLSRLLTPKATFVFIAHPRDLSDIPRKFPFASLLPGNILEGWFRHQWPFVASYITGVRTVRGSDITGAMLIAPLTTVQMLQDPALARKRVFQSVQLAQKMGARIVGLGAFTSIVTKDGLDLVGKVNVGITTGNTHSAGIAVQNVIAAAVLTNLSLPHSTVAIVGAAGSVGSACAKLLAPVVSKLVLVDIKREGLRRVREQISIGPVDVVTSSKLDGLSEADVVIAATNSPHGIISAHHLRSGAIVIDAAQPKNVSQKIPSERPDVLVIESAIVQTPGVNCHFDLGLKDGEALGCLSETMLLAAIGRHSNYSIGKADPKQAAEILSVGRELGFKLAYFRNSSGYITPDDLRRVAKARSMTIPDA